MSPAASKKDGYYIKRVREKDWDSIIALVWRVFMEYNASSYSLEGIKNFHRFLTDDMLLRMIRLGEYRVFGCFNGDEPVGAISVRNRNHISLLFVEGRCQHKGIASKLLRYLCDDLLCCCGQVYVTVNSSPYAVDFYHKMGFTDTDVVQSADGITFTPMKFFL